MTEAERIAAGLTEAQRDTILGHMVEIPPEEYEELQALGLKGEPEKQRVVYYRTIYPITDKGLAVRAILQGDKP